MAESNVNIHIKGHDEASGPVGRVEASLQRLRHRGGEASKTMSELAGKSGSGGLAAVAGGLGGMIGPMGLAAGATAALVGVGGSLLETYRKTQEGELALSVAAKGHGINLESLNKIISDNSAEWATYAVSEEQARGAITGLVRAGLNQKQILEAMPRIMDLAKAKHLDMADATSLFTKGIMGNAKALLEYGIKLPPVVSSEKELAKARAGVSKAADGLARAHERLTAVQVALSGKTRLTASDHLRLATAQKGVKTATDDLAAANTALSSVQTVAAKRGDRLLRMYKATDPAIGGTRKATTQLAQTQTRLANAWEHISAKVGPALIAVFGWLADRLALVVEGVGTAIDWISSLAAWLGPKLQGPIKVVSAVLGVMGNVIRVETTAISALIGWISQLIGWLGARLQGPAKAVGDVFNGVAGIIGTVVSAIQTVIGWIATAIGAIQGFLGKVGEALSAASSLYGTGNVLGFDPNNPNAAPRRRAAGGPVWPGGVFTVGEQGPETLIMGRSGGVVIPNGGAGAAPTMHIHFDSVVPYSPAQAQAAARALSPEMFREWRRQRLI